MKTKIIISEGWKIIKEYDFLINMSVNDFVEFQGHEYRVDSCTIKLENDTMIILLR